VGRSVLSSVSESREEKRGDGLRPRLCATIGARLNPSVGNPMMTSGFNSRMMSVSKAPSSVTTSMEA
jgi:hypothetical protein